MRTLKTKKILNFTSWVLNGLVVVAIVGVQSWANISTASANTSQLTIEDLISRDVISVMPEVRAVAPIVERESVREIEPVCGGNEARWLACAVYFEARSESLEGQFAVALSILNRVEDSRWPNSIEAVVRQGEDKGRNRCQYSFMCDGKPEHIENLSAWAVAQFVASKAMGEHQEASVTCAHSYRADYVTNTAALGWFATLEPAESIGAHIFYCDKAV